MRANAVAVLSTPLVESAEGLNGVIGLLRLDADTEIGV